MRKAGFEVETYDAMAKFDGMGEIASRIEQAKPDVVATGAYTALINDALKILKLAKRVNLSILTLLGGVHSTFCWGEILERDPTAVDYIIRGEGEETVVELLEALSVGRDVANIKGIAFFREGKIISTSERPFIKNLDALPTAWDLVEWKDYSYRPNPGSTLAVVSSSRGCNQRCTFCSQQVFWKRTWRARRPESFVAELEHLNKKYGVNAAMITDETPTLDRRRWEEILGLLIEKNMNLELLMETRVDDILRDENILEKYWRAGIRHIKLAQHYNPDLAFFLAIAPWPYSEIYDELKPYVEVFDYSQYNLVEPVVKPISMSREELNQELINAFCTFYMGKLAQLPKMSRFKRDYMIAVTRLLATHSYLAKYMKGMGHMPDEMQRLLA